MFFKISEPDNVKYKDKTALNAQTRRFAIERTPDYWGYRRPQTESGLSSGDIGTFFFLAPGRRVDPILQIKYSKIAV